MGEQLGRQINPDSIRTELMIGREPSRIGLPKKRMISTGMTTDEKSLYVLVGSAGQIGLHLEVERYPGLETPVSIGNIFSMRDHHPFDEEYEHIFRVEPKQIKKVVQDGGLFIEGPYVVENRPGERSIAVPGVEGMWAPVSTALGSNWFIETEGQDLEALSKRHTNLSDSEGERLLTALNKFRETGEWPFGGPSDKDEWWKDWRDRV